MAVTLDRFRELFAGTPMPVAVVAVPGADGVAGATVSSFCSLSAEPPLVFVIVPGLVADCDFTDSTPLVHHRRRFLLTG